MHAANHSALLLAASALALTAGCASSTSSEPVDARRLHFDAIVVDTHADTTPYFERDDWDFGARHDASETDMDLPRIREGGLDVEFWSIYMGEREEPGSAIREALQRIDGVHRMVERHPDQVALAGTVAEIRAAVAEGKLASLMGIEGGHIIESDLAALRSFYRLGARYMTLTHSFHTDWADSSGTTSVPEPEHGGLTPFGENVVREMNRLGMMVDVSHVSDETFHDVLAVTAAPVIASHSSCRAVYDHPRNLSDAMLRALADNGGVVMINFYPAYIDAEAGAATRAFFEEHGPTFAAKREELGDGEALAAWRRDFLAANPVPKAPLDVLLDHFVHAIEVAGPDHVGIGADWDGVPSMPEGLEEVSLLPRLTEGLLARDVPPATVTKVLGENLLRAMAKVEGVAAELRAAERSDGGGGVD